MEDYQNHERWWMKYGNYFHWQAYKCERCQYNKMVTYKRKSKITKEILDCGKDTNIMSTHKQYNRFYIN